MLDSIGIRFSTDKSSRDHGYLHIYEKYLNGIKDNSMKILEIGVDTGGSLKMWEQYLLQSTIYGMDIVDYTKYQSGRIKILIGDQENRDSLANIALLGPFDIIIDDGGHTMKQQQVSLGYLFPYLAPGGLYIIEDLWTSYLDPMYNPTRTTKTTLRMLANLIAFGVIDSDFITNEEVKYVLNNYKKCTMEQGKKSEICFIVKK